LRANLKSISRRCHLFEVAFVWELTKEIIHLPLGCRERAGHASGEESQPVRVVRPRRGQHILHRVPPGLLEGPVRALGEGAASPAISRPMHRRELRRYMRQEHPVRGGSGRGLRCSLPSRTTCETGLGLLSRAWKDASMPRETCERECWGALKAGASQFAPTRSAPLWKLVGRGECAVARVDGGMALETGSFGEEASPSLWTRVLGGP